MGRRQILKESAYRSVKKYSFQFIDKQYKIFTDKESLDYLIKWNLDKNLKILSYSFENEFEDYDEEKLIMNIFHCREVIEALDCSPFSSNKTNHEAILTIEIEEIPCTILSMDIFQKISNSSIVLADGTIRKCFEEYIDNIVVADELRNMLLIGDSENYILFNDEERDEFLFHIFKHLCIGGILNQYEDNINPYLSMTKMLYKDLIGVRKTGKCKTITIISKVYGVIYKINGKPVIPSSKLHMQDFLYIVINPSLKNLSILSHIW